MVDIAPHAFKARRYTQLVQIGGAIEVLVLYRGRHGSVAAILYWAIKAAEELQDRRSECRLHAMLGRLAALTHQYEVAEHEFGVASTLVAALGDPLLQSSILEFRAGLERARGHRPTAVALLRQCLAIDTAHDNSRALGLHSRMLANLLAEDPSTVAEAAKLVTVAASHTTDTRNEGRRHIPLARIHLTMGNADLAEEAWRRSRELGTRVRATQYSVELDEIEAEIAALRGNLGRARQLWLSVAERLRHAGDPRALAVLDRFNSTAP